MSWCHTCGDEYPGKSGMCPNCDSLLSSEPPRKPKFGEGVSFVDTAAGRAWKGEEFARIWEGPYMASEPIVRALETASIPCFRDDGLEPGRCSVMVALSYAEEATAVAAAVGHLDIGFVAPEDPSDLLAAEPGYFYDQPWVRYSFAAVALLLVFLLIVTQ